MVSYLTFCLRFYKNSAQTSASGSLDAENDVLQPFVGKRVLVFFLWLVRRYWNIFFNMRIEYVLYHLWKRTARSLHTLWNNWRAQYHVYRKRRMPRQYRRFELLAFALAKSCFGTEFLSPSDIWPFSLGPVGYGRLNRVGDNLSIFEGLAEWNISHLTK